MSRRVLPLFLVTAFLLAVAPPTIRAQSVRVLVLTAESLAPIPTAFVSLLDEETRPVNRGLTNLQGEVVLEAPGPGRYRLTVEMLGRVTEESDPFPLQPGSPATFQFPMEAAAIHLSEIRVEGERKCRIRPEDGAELARVWEEARKALEIQAWTDEEGSRQFRVDSWERTLSRDGQRVESESLLGSTITDRNPIKSLPAQELMEEGFVQEAGRGRVEYFGPDASVLLSDLFLETHCFRLVANEERPGAIGLGFEPVGDDIPDIQGRFWLDRESAALRFLEFEYTNLPDPVYEGATRGWVQFDRLPDGFWIVRKWWIQVPLVTRSPVDGVLRKVGIREVSQEVTDLGRSDGPAPARNRGEMQNDRPGHPGRPFVSSRR